MLFLENGRLMMASRKQPNVSSSKETEMSLFVLKLHNRLCEKFNLQECEIPEVAISAFKEGEKLFGPDGTKRVTLLGKGRPSKIELVQFDPYFFSSQVICRYQGCSNKPEKQPPQKSKRDLFLCPKHRNQIVEEIYRKPKCPPKKKMKMPKKEKYAGYIQIIGVLDAVYRKLKHVSENREGSSSKKRKVVHCYPLTRRDILDFRNILILTNVLLNPNGEQNLMLRHIFTLFLEWSTGGEVSETQVQVVLALSDIVLRAFGVVYRNLPQTEDNPGKIVGWGIGGLTTFAGFPTIIPYLNRSDLITMPLRQSLPLVAPPAFIHFTFALVMAYFSGCIGSGLYQMFTNRRRLQITSERINHDLHSIYSARTIPPDGLEIGILHLDDGEDDDEAEDDGQIDEQEQEVGESEDKANTVEKDN